MHVPSTPPSATRESATAGATAAEYGGGRSGVALMRHFFSPVLFGSAGKHVA